MTRPIQLLLAPALLVGAFLPSSTAFGAECRVPGKPDSYKWAAPVSAYEVFYPTAPPAGDPSTWSFSKQRTFYSRVNKNTPEEACASWSKFQQPTSIWTTAQRSKTAVMQINATLFKCAFDCTNDGTVNDNDFSACPAEIFALTDLQTEPMCDQEPQGPYSSSDDPNATYTRGGSFSKTKRNAIITRNRGEFTLPGITSDVKGMTSTDGTPLDPFTVLSLVAQTLPPFEDDPDVSEADAASVTPKTTGTYAETVQIDHLIPRIDKYGCGCGRNSYSNALAISAKLNGQMSNDGTNAARQVILAKTNWTPAWTPPHIITLDVAGGDQDLDEADGDPANAAVAPNQTDAELSGCSATGAGSDSLTFSAIVIGLACVGRRRRELARSNAK